MSGGDRQTQGVSRGFVRLQWTSNRFSIHLFEIINCRRILADILLLYLIMPAPADITQNILLFMRLLFSAMLYIRTKSSLTRGDELNI